MQGRARQGNDPSREILRTCPHHPNLPPINIANAVCRALPRSLKRPPVRLQPHMSVKTVPYGWGRRQPLWSHSHRLEPASSAQCPPGASLLASEMESKRLQGGVLP